jgi:PAS domain S-box-containing protein
MVSKFPILDDQSKPVMVGGIAIDITERRKAEEALRESEESYRVVAETAGDGILKIDADSLILFANRAVEKIFGYAPAELLGRPVTMLMPEYLRHVHKASMRQYIETGERHMSWDSVELPGLHKDGREIPLEISFGEFTKEGKHIFTGMIRDITERKRTERHIETQHAVTRILSEFSTVEEIAPRILRAICETSNWAVGVFWTVDHTAGVLRPVATWHQPSAATDVSLFETKSREITFRSGKGLPGRVWATGQAAWINDVVIDDNFPRAPAALAAGLHGAGGFPISLNTEVLGVMEFFSSEIRELDAQLQQMLTAVGSQIGSFLERRRLQEQLLQGQKLESIGLLAGGIAHDFNNLLTGILGGASVVLDTLPKNHPSEEVLNNVIHASERAADLTRQLLAYAGKGQFIVEPVHLSDLVRHITDLIRSSIPRSVHLLLELDPDIPAVQADAGQLQQLIMNLVINAAEAVGDKGSGAVIARTGAQSVDETYIREFEMDAAAGASGLSVGRYVYLEVIDTGTGMDEATKARIFDPFFTTKFTGRGLGLAATLGIVRSHKGALSVSSLPGAGSTFRVLFPAVTAEIVVPEEPAEAREKVSGTVLVVDDEDVVRRTVKVALEGRGFEVVVAENGREAIELLRKNGDQISLVLLDLTMPVMSGEETLQRLREIRADVPVIISSGYSEAEARRRMGNMGALTFIQKPYTGARLVEAISGVLRPSV